MTAKANATIRPAPPHPALWLLPLAGALLAALLA